MYKKKYLKYLDKINKLGGGMDDLPDDLNRSIAGYLVPKDVVSLSQASKNLLKGLKTNINNTNCIDSSNNMTC